MLRQISHAVQGFERHCALLNSCGDSVQVMERLMSISTDYWSTFINIEADGTRDFGTPRMSEGIIYMIYIYIIYSLSYTAL